MRSALGYILAVGLTLLGGETTAAQSVDEIVAKNIEAKGGYARLKATNSVRTTATGKMQGQEVTIVTSTKRPYLLRTEVTVTSRPPAGVADQGRPRKWVNGFDGQTMWMAIGDMAPQVLPAGPQSEAMKRTSQIDSPLLDYKEHGTKIELGKEVVEGGRRMHHLLVTPKGAPTMHYYIDGETNLESRMVIEVDEGGQRMKMEMRFADFREVEGRMVPFSITQFANGTQLGQIQFQKIEFDVPLEASMFRMPK